MLLIFGSFKTGCLGKDVLETKFTYNSQISIRHEIELLPYKQTKSSFFTSCSATMECRSWQKVTTIGSRPGILN